MLNEQTTEEKLDYIFSMEEMDELSDEDWVKINVLIHDSDPEIRMRASELFPLFPSDKSEKALLSLLDDGDYLVRSSVCDSLSFSSSPDTRDRLTRLTKDKRFLVRGYAALSIADIELRIGQNPEETIEFLKSFYQKESSEWVKIAIARSLYLLGEYSYGDILLSAINSRYYKNRCFVISLLKELVESKMETNLPNMLSTLQKRVEVEKAYSVKTELQHILEKLTLGK